MLRAIPGRRWDAVERAWRIPLEPDSAESLARLLASLSAAPEVSGALARALERRRARRRRDVCLIELARPEEDWRLTFATDLGGEAVRALLEHPDARTLPVLGRALLPLDERSAELVELLRSRAQVRVSEAAARALSPSRRAGEPSAGDGARADHEPRPLRHDVEFRRDRHGGHWIMVAPGHAALARALAGRAGLRAREGPAGTLGLAAIEHDAEQIAALLERLEAASVEQRVIAWLERARTWRGNIEVEGPREAPAFVLLGDFERLPRRVRELATRSPGGASVPLTLECWRLLREQLDGWPSASARRCVTALEEGRPAPPAVLELSAVHEDPTLVLAPGHDGTLLERFARLRGALAPARRGSAHEHSRLPAIRADPFCVPELDALLAGARVWIAADALALLQEMREQHARAAGLVELSCATEAPLELARLGGELKPFQRAGVSYLLAQRRAFLADEQGLGKTIEALATLEADNAFPALVVCPASLKLNWLREIERWLPDRSAAVLRGNGRGAPIAPADVTVVNYEIVSARLEQLCEIAPRALVLDESHHCKNAAAKRTQAVQRLAGAVPRDGLVLALSGTPVINRAAELVSQLRILGRLEDFGSGARFSERFQGPDAHVRLHWHLRARCFVRRLKADVLPQLPAKTRAVVPVELDNEPEYRLAERDLIAWLQTQPLDLRELDAKVAAALRAERLVRLNALKLLAARGKLHAALTWIHDFCHTGERLVVFAHHREIARALLDRFPTALHVLGEDSHAARDAAVRAFQAEDHAGNQLIICSIEVAGQGITLTRSSNVVFLELDWTPAKHDQAEDRCHRIGQHDAVNASYLLAAGTVDETIAKLLERKRAVIGAVTDGRERDEEAVIDGLVRELRGTPYRHLRSVA
ncbi:MAG: SWI/SNF-related matrix-associated actin-dependent regulator of chromatin subfamily A-like protein 1 [Solirubrobacteraceae bacterium]|nr:SWI/SNF-related matrix-associated actin-dependent regulator of chromatin subfamily A-like protein 1 [Solirubrobacteraceae bacterium]